MVRTYQLLLDSKANEDAAAFIRNIAQYRDRNVKALEETVLNATSYSASEALDNNVIDIIANDVDDLLPQLDGRLANVQGLNVTLETRGLKLQEIERTPVERFLRLLANTLSLQYFDTLKNLRDGAFTKFIFPMEFTNLLNPFMRITNQTDEAK